MQRRLIGLDLDNTIIDYERAFAPVAEEIGLIPRGQASRPKRRSRLSCAARLEKKPGCVCRVRSMAAISNAPRLIRA